MRDDWLRERVAVAKRDGVRLGAVTVDDVTFGHDPVFFVNGQYAGYLHDIPGHPDYPEDKNDGY